jgi:uncharacterized protein
MEPVEITTDGGIARVELDGDRGTVRFLLVLTHGAGGTVEAPDLLAARDAGLQLGGMVARVTQPYRVRGARAPGSAVRQDAAWVEIVAALGALAPHSALVQGGRSNGARVACRTAAAVGARAVLALAFPLRPPERSPVGVASRVASGTGAAGGGRAVTGSSAARRAGTGQATGAARSTTDNAAAGASALSRVAELHAARAGGAMVLVVNGERDPFGIPGAQDADRVVVVPGETHALKGHRAAIVAAVIEWLPTVL